MLLKPRPHTAGSAGVKMAFPFGEEVDPFERYARR
jgi:hypothetical protein